MKILIYSHYFMPSMGGVESLLRLLAQGLVERNAGEVSRDSRRVDLTVVTATPAILFDDSTLPYRVVRRPGLRRLVHLIGEADVVHLAGPSLLPMAVAWLTGKPFVIEHHGYQAVCPNGLLFLQPSQTVCPGHFLGKRRRECLRCCSIAMGWAGSVRQLLLTFPRQWLCRKAAANVAITDYVARRLDLPNSRTIYYGVEDARLASAQGRSESGSLQMAYVGRLVEEKGLPLLLQAAKYLQDDGVPFKLKFIGDGPERERLEKLAESLGVSDSVQFTGTLKGSDLNEAVKDVEVAVMPSIWEETAGLSAIEQMMRGRVVVAADIGGLSEVVGDAGLKFAPRDPHSLHSVLRKLADNRGEVARIGAAARRRAESVFTRERMIGDHLHLYREIGSAEDTAARGTETNGDPKHTTVS
jgi:glycosyltransferase involved in cell wall biosynthesis